MNQPVPSFVPTSCIEALCAIASACYQRTPKSFHFHDARAVGGREALIGFSEVCPLSPARARSIAALLSQRNVEEAARVVGISPNTLLRWMKIPEFDKAYTEAPGGSLPNERAPPAGNRRCRSDNLEAHG